MARFVSHTNGTETIDGAKGKNAKMERGGSVSANPIWTPGGAQSPKQRMDAGKYANQTGDYGNTTVRDTPKNQHGITGEVEHVAHQPNLRGSDAG
tara:strand:- start:588 stop:872 length:285 start_codon:yes stop_codon:yes gene_type:complete